MTSTEVIPIEQKSYGYVQRSSFANRDLFHEEVVELESPLAELAKADTLVHTFLLLGDQNAGKSTFIHAFCHDKDANFPELLAIFPILSATFVNTRFVMNDASRSIANARDEPPFIDTDLARGTVLLTLEDFAFWLSEHELAVDSLPNWPRPSSAPAASSSAATIVYKSRKDALPIYALTQFIEIGGDHLDAMVLASKPGASDGVFKPQSHQETDIVHRSVELVRTSARTIYFVNMNDLLVSTPPGHSTEPKSFDQVALARLEQRFRFLDELFAESSCSQHQILVYLSRIPSNCRLNWQKVSSQIGTEDLSELQTLPSNEQIRRLMLLFFGNFAHKFKALRVLEVNIAEHLLPDGALDVTAVFRTLAKLYATKMTSSLASDPAPFVTRQLVACFKHTGQRIAAFADGSVVFHPWITKAIFWKHLSDLHDEAVEIPEPTMIQAFEGVARRLQASNFALLHSKAGFSQFNVVFTYHASDGSLPTYLWKPENFYAKHAQGGAKETTQLAVRFPYSSHLFSVMESFFKRQVPLEFWLLGPVEPNSTQKQLHPFAQSGSDAKFGGELVAAMASVETELATDVWPKLLAKVETNQATVLMWLIEEWLLAWKLSHAVVSSPDSKAWASLPTKFPVATREALPGVLEFLGSIPIASVDEARTSADCDVVQIHLA